MQFVFHCVTADLTWHGQDSSGRERSKTRRRISRYPQVDLVFASSRQKISNALLSLPAAVGEWSRRDASDIDGLSREAETSGSE